MKPLTSNNFIQWRNDQANNRNYYLLYDLTFNIFLGLKCFRSSIRRNNSLLALAKRQKVCPNMNFGNHHIYKYLIVNDMKNRVQTPKEVSDYKSRNESFSKCGETLYRKRGDYVTENENHHLKSHLPPGVPTLQCWIISIRNHQKLVKNHEEVFKKAGFTDPATESSSISSFENEVRMLRIVLESLEFYPIHKKSFSLEIIERKSSPS